MGFSSINFTESHPKIPTISYEQLYEFYKRKSQNEIFDFKDTDNGFILFIQETVAPFRNHFTLSIKKDKSTVF